MINGGFDFYYCSNKGCSKNVVICGWCKEKVKNKLKLCSKCYKTKKDNIYVSSIYAIQDKNNYSHRISKNGLIEKYIDISKCGNLLEVFLNQKII